MRLSPPLPPAPPLRWIPIAALPPDLREAIALRKLLEPVRGPLGAWWHPTPPHLGLFLLGTTTLAILAPAAIDRGVPLWPGVPLTLAAATWWALRRIARPRVGPSLIVGQGALLSSTAVIVVDHSTVAIVPAEHVERRDGRCVYGDTILDGAAHAEAWVESLADTIRRACLDAEARETDPWRAAALLPGRTSVTASRRRHIVGLVAATLGTGLLASGAFLLLRESAPAAPADAITDAEPLWMAPARRPGDPWARLRQSAAEGKEDAVRELLVSRYGFDLDGDEARTLRARLNARCDATWGDPSDDVDPRRAVRIALKLRCIDPAMEIPAYFMVRRCVETPAGKDCERMPRAEQAIREEVASFLRQQLVGLGMPARVRFRDLYSSDALYLRVERTVIVTALPTNTTVPLGSALWERRVAAAVFRRADVIDRSFFVQSRLVNAHTTVAMDDLSDRAPRSSIRNASW